LEVMVNNKCFGLFHIFVLLDEYYLLSKSLRWPYSGRMWVGLRPVKDSAKVQKKKLKDGAKKANFLDLFFIEPMSVLTKSGTCP